MKKNPKFGDSQTPWRNVFKFYEFWENFNSRREFGYVTKYNLNDAENRRIRKIMQKENSKLKNNAKREVSANAQKALQT